MMTPSTRSRALLVALALMAAGCAAPVVPTRLLASAPGPVAAAALAGMVRFPVGLVGADAVATIDGARVIPTGVAKVVPTGVGKVVPTGVGKYALLAMDADPSEELPVAGAAVVVRDPATRLPIAGAVGSTDAQGRFRVEGLPAGAVALVEVSFTAGAKGETFHLLTLARPLAEGPGPIAEVGWATTAAAGAALRAAAADPGALANLDLTAFSNEARAIRGRAAALPAEERLAWLRQVVVDVAPATTEAGATAPLPLPSAPPALPVLGSPAPFASALPVVLTSTVPGALTSAVPGVLASTVPAALTSTVPAALTSTVPATLDALLPGDTASAVPAAVASTGAALTAPVTETVASVAPALVETTTGVEGAATGGLGLLATPAPTPTPKPSPSPSPTPAPSAAPSTGLVGEVVGGLGL